MSVYRGNSCSGFDWSFQRLLVEGFKGQSEGAEFSFGSPSRAFSKP